MISIKSKKTIFNGVQFRSKLEAQWAVFFDNLSIAFEYEPILDEVDIGVGIVWYKPDFFLPDIDQWVEVKPVDFRNMEDGDKKKAYGWARDYESLLILVGGPSIPKENTKAHYLLTWSERKKKFYLRDHLRWCECPKCHKIDIQEGGGIPSNCDNTCYRGPSHDLFGDILEPEGHKSSRLKNACRIAHCFKY
jgi:hypothetical protein